jgi:hypothetical protein
LMPLMLWVSGVSHWLYRKGYIRDKPFDLMLMLRIKGRRWQKLALYYGNKTWQYCYSFLLAVFRMIRAWLTSKIH